MGGVDCLFASPSSPPPSVNHQSKLFYCLSLAFVLRLISWCIQWIFRFQSKKNNRSSLLVGGGITIWGGGSSKGRGTILCCLGGDGGLVIYTFKLHHHHHHRHHHHHHHHQSSDSCILKTSNLNFQPNYHFTLAGDLSPNILYPIISGFIGWSKFKHKSPSVFNISNERPVQRKV